MDRFYCGILCKVTKGKASFVERSGTTARHAPFVSHLNIDFNQVIEIHPLKSTNVGFVVKHKRQIKLVCFYFVRNSFCGVSCLNFECDGHISPSLPTVPSPLVAGYSVNAPLALHVVVLYAGYSPGVGYYNIVRLH